MDRNNEPAHNLARREVEEQLWFHGRKRTDLDAESLLLEEGDFLVRVRKVPFYRKVEFVLSIKDQYGHSHLTIARINGQWQLKPTIFEMEQTMRFRTIPALINYYQNNEIDSGLRARRPIYRPICPIENYKIRFDMEKDLVGLGRFGAVYKGKYDKGLNHTVDVAIKICNNIGSTNTTKGTILLEAARKMCYFVHDYVTLIHGIVVDHSPVLLVVEYCPGGSLDKHLQQQKGNITVGELMCYVMEASRGMRYLHERNCVHRDLSARNCLISARGHIKIADFKMSKLLRRDEMPREPMDVRYMAPELLEKGRKWFTWESDVWAFGMLIYEIFNEGEKPWPNLSPAEIVDNIRNERMPTLSQRLPQRMNDVVERMWKKSPGWRQSFGEVCSRVWRIMKQCEMPKASQFAVNRLPGVERIVGVKEEHWWDGNEAPNFG